MQMPIQWLLQGPAWIEYRTRLDLLHQDAAAPEVLAVRQVMLIDPQIRALISGLANWPGKVISSHKSAGQPYHRLSFLAELGLQADDPGMQVIIDRILEHPSAQGPFQLPTQISAGYGSSGKKVWAWALCDAPLLLYALVRFGMGTHPQVQKGLAYVTGLVRENGWPCAVSPELGSFRGPGRKSDPCPYATLIMLKLLSQVDSLQDNPAALSGIETLLKLWEQRREQHPYIFYMGTDFSKLKAPMVWYDILHVLDVLSRFPAARTDARLRDMAGVVAAQADAEGCFTPESIWNYWKDWEFGQKKVPSRWVTLLAQRALARLG